MPVTSRILPQILLLTADIDARPSSRYTVVMVQFKTGIFSMGTIKLFISLAIAAVLAGVIALPTPAALAGPNCSVNSDIDSEEQAFLGLINDYRRDSGLGPLALSTTLTKAAAWKSQHMASNSYFDHTDVGLGRSFTDRLSDCGYNENTWKGENIAAGNATGQAAFDQWRNSSGHNANMLNVNFNAIGIGRAHGANTPYGWYWTTEFGGVIDTEMPLPPPPPPTSTPAPPPPPPPASQPVTSGDVDCSGSATSLDAILVLQLSAHLVSSLACPAEGDVNGDNSIGVLDAALILQMTAGLLTAPPG